MMEITQLLEHLPKDIVVVIVITVLIVLIVTKIIPSFSHIDTFLTNKSKSKAKKIKQALKAPNLSEEVKSYLRDKLSSEYFYRATGISASSNNISKIIAICGGNNDINDVHFKYAGKYIDYGNSKIEVRINNFDKVSYYMVVFSALCLSVVSVIIVLTIPFSILLQTSYFDFESAGYIFWIFILFAVLITLFSMLKDIRAYISARKIKQYLDNNQTV